MANEIVKGQIGNALESVAPDHIVATADGIYDETAGKYQDTINAETAEKLSGLEHSTGYYECDTPAATAAKSVSGGDYQLPTTAPYGGSMKIKFNHANTAANPTLSISGCTAKPLYYDGARASSSNTWADGETVEVYFDGAHFQANNVAGGGNFATGEKVRETGIDDEPTAGSDNLVKSGGVYSQISQLDQELNGEFGYIDYSVTLLDDQYYSYSQTLGTMGKSTSSRTGTKCVRFNCNPGDKFKIYGRGTTFIKLYAFTNADREVLLGNAETTDWRTDGGEVTAPEGTTMLYINFEPYDSTNKIQKFGVIIEGISSKVDYLEQHSLKDSDVVNIPGTNLESVMSQKGATDLVSEYNVSTNNNNTEYTFAQAVALVPVSLQKGGLTIKYIDSTTHKYTIKSLMSSTWSTTESNWQSIDESLFPFVGKTIEGFRIDTSSLVWKAGNYLYKIITLPKDKNSIVIKANGSSIQAFFLKSNPTPVDGESVTSIISGGILAKDLLVDIPDEANYLYCYWQGNTVPTEIIINGIDILNDYPNNIESIAYNAQVEVDNNNFLPHSVYRGYINSGVWTEIGVGTRTYKIIEIPEVIVGKILTLIGNNIGNGVLYFLSSYSTPTEGQSASIVGSQVSIAVNTTVNVVIPEGTKYIYILSYSNPTSFREPISMSVAGIELRDNLKNSVLSLASRNTPISPGSITEDLLSPEVTDKLVYDVPSYMQDEFVTTKNTLDNLVNANSCSVALVTDLHITPSTSGNNFKAVKESVQTLGVLSQQFPLSFSMALGDYVAAFTPDSKEGGIRCIEYVNQWMSSIWGRSNMLAGNHEKTWFGTSSYGLTLTEYLGLSYNRYVQKFGYNIDYSGTNINVSHSDDAISKIRHIFLNSFAASYIDSTAITQIVSVVSSAPSDYGIVVYSHFGVSVWNAHGGGSYENPVVFPPVKDAIDAIKTEISGSTKELICWVGGHTHVDHILVYNDTPVVTLLRTCLGTEEGPSQDGITYNNKVVGTPTMETSTILTIRRDTGKLYFTRIGCGVDMEVNYKSTGGQTIGRVWNTLAGVVYDSDGSTPISGVTVSMKFIGATYTATTNASGEYSFDKLPKESGILSTSLTGYEFDDIPLAISGNMTQNVIAES